MPSRQTTKTHPDDEQEAAIGVNTSDDDGWIRREVLGTAVLGGGLLAGGAATIPGLELSLPFQGPNSGFEAVTKAGEDLVVVGEDNGKRILLGLHEDGSVRWHQRTARRQPESSQLIQTLTGTGYGRVVAVDRETEPETDRAFTARYYDHGERRWSLQVGPSRTTAITDLATQDDSVFAVGTVATASAAGRLWHLPRLRADDWETPTTLDADSVSGVAMTSMGGLVVGAREDPVQQKWVGVLDADGELDSQRTLDPGTFGPVAATTDGFVAAAGGSTISSGVRGLTRDGDTRWEASPNFVDVHDVLGFGNGGWAVLAEEGNDRTVVIAGDEDGNLSWRHQLDDAIVAESFAEGHPRTIVVVGTEHYENGYSGVAVAVRGGNDTWKTRYSDV
ncbi:hypothetical protein [Haloarchaeobius sp. DFWS5]|uniref:hypothetical protein n=1 Tax=Haloarchaeobius sp. DFWS5 TaxID=3446114 RepID=UPI003EC0414E